jgi:hypothetical protein
MLVPKKPSSGGTPTQIDEDNAPAECGIVMPISPMEDCTAEHWGEVKDVIIEAVNQIETPRFACKLVSDGDEVNVIHKRIVENLYNNEIVVCDISCKNPNVMFELGMRLAFDKPTVIIKDEKTNYSFDTSVIEHIEYPRDMRFHKINAFKVKLASKILHTYEVARSDKDFSQFLNHFGAFSPKKIDRSVFTDDDYI